LVRLILSIAILIAFFSGIYVIYVLYGTYFHFYDKEYNRYLKKYKDRTTSGDNDYIRGKYLNKLGRKAYITIRFFKLFSNIEDKFSNGGLIVLLIPLVSFIILLLWLLIDFIPNTSVLYKIIISLINSLPFEMGIKLKVFLKDHQEFIVIILGAINAIITAMLTLMTTLYTFAYRERKTNSISLNTLSRNKWFFVSISFIVFTLIFSWLTVKFLSKEELFETPQSSIRFLILIVLLLISTVIIAEEIKRFYNSLDLKFTTKEMLSDLKSLIYLNAIAHKNITDYKQIGLYIESFYQCLTLSYEKNIYELYTQHFEEWATLIENIKIGEKDKDIDFYPRTIFEVLHTKNEEDFSVLYELIIKCHVELIITVMNSNRLLDLQRVSDCFYKLMPYDHFPKLKETYLKHLHELMIFTIENHPERISIIIKYLEDYAGSEIQVNSEKNSSLSVYKSLVIKSSENNSVKDLSPIAYSMIKTIRKKRNNLEYKINNITISMKVNSDQHYKAALYNLLQACLKSIELSHYQCTGFLVKMMVTVFDDINLFKEVLETFVSDKNNKGENNPYIYRPQSEYKFEFEIKPNFNPNTFDYCCDKLLILLNAQRKYAVEYELPFLENQPDKAAKFILEPESDSFISHKREKYYLYLFTKIYKAKDKYGLLFLSNLDFMKNLLKEILESKKMDTSFADRWESEIKNDGKITETQQIISV
jgi:hypothetical protein